jgi:hypothetical protein
MVGPFGRHGRIPVRRGGTAQRCPPPGYQSRVSLAKGVMIRT